MESFVILVEEERVVAKWKNLKRDYGYLQDVEFLDFLLDQENGRRDGSEVDQAMIPPAVPDLNIPIVNVSEEAPVIAEDTDFDHLYETLCRKRIEKDFIQICCDLCNKVFKKKHHLAEHSKRVHNKERTAVCDLCPKMFYRSSDLKRHKLGKHSAKQFINNKLVCDEQTPIGDSHPRLLSQVLHEAIEGDALQESTHRLKKYYCDLHDKRFSKKENFEAHIVRSHDRRKPYSCDICRKEFFWLHTLRKHTRVKHAAAICDRPIETKKRVVIFVYCEICNRRFTSKYAREQHMKYHTGQLIHCEICDRGFPSVKAIQSHNIKHTGERPFGCDSCDKKYSTKQQLIAHQRLHSGEMVVCHICGKQYANESALSYHKSTHSLVKQFTCGVCGKAFRNKHLLNSHEIRHNADAHKKHRCEVCGRSFIQAYALKIHSRMHSNERPYNCDVCGKTFRSSGVFKNHVRIHTGERPYICDICGNSFSQGSALRNHMKTHGLMKCSVKRRDYPNTQQMAELSDVKGFDPDNRVSTVIVTQSAMGKTGSHDFDQKINYSHNLLCGDVDMLNSNLMQHFVAVNNNCQSFPQL